MAFVETNHRTMQMAQIVTHRSRQSDAWRRFHRNRAAVGGLLVVACFGILAIAAPLVTTDTALQVVPGNTYRAPVWVYSSEPRKTGLMHHILGTDSVGRDVLARLLFGARVSLMVGVVPNLIVLGIGLIVGGTAGLIGGHVDNILMRVTDVMFAFPDILFLIIMVTALRETTLGKAWNGLLLVFLALSITSWAGMARLIRSQVMGVKQQDFVEAARVIGCSRMRIVLRHILPNMLGPLLVALTLGIPGAISAEAALGFLGIGMQAVTPGTETVFPTSWGILLGEGIRAMHSQPWILISTIAAIGVTALAFTMIGDGLRDALDPRDKTGS